MEALESNGHRIRDEANAMTFGILCVLIQCKFMGEKEKSCESEKSAHQRGELRYNGVK